MEERKKKQENRSRRNKLSGRSRATESGSGGTGAGKPVEGLPRHEREQTTTYESHRQPKETSGSTKADTSDSPMVRDLAEVETATKRTDGPRKRRTDTATKRQARPNRMKTEEGRISADKTKEKGKRGGKDATKQGKRTK